MPSARWRLPLTMPGLLAAGILSALLHAALLGTLVQHPSTLLAPADVHRLSARWLTPPPAPQQATPNPTPAPGVAAHTARPVQTPPSPSVLPPAALSVQNTMPEPKLAIAPASSVTALGTTSGQATPPTNPVGVLAFELPVPGQMHYAVHYSDAHGSVQQAQGTLNWRHDGQRYQLQLQVMQGLHTVLRQTSEGRIGVAGLEPERFSDRRARRSEQAVHFQREHSLISFSNNSRAAQLLPGTQDRLSLWLQLAGWLAAQAPTRPLPDRVSLPVASLAEADVWHLAAQGNSRVTRADGVDSVRALPFIRAERRAFDDRVEVWFAPDLDHWPVRIRLLYPGGSGYDFVWMP